MHNSTSWRVTRLLSALACDAERHHVIQEWQIEARADLLEVAVPAPTGRYNAITVLYGVADDMESVATELGPGHVGEGLRLRLPHRLRRGCGHRFALSFDASGLAHGHMLRSPVECQEMRIFTRFTSVAMPVSWHAKGSSHLFRMDRDSKGPSSEIGLFFRDVPRHQMCGLSWMAGGSGPAEGVEETFEDRCGLVGLPG